MQAMQPCRKAAFYSKYAISHDDVVQVLPPIPVKLQTIGLGVRAAVMANAGVATCSNCDTAPPTLISAAIRVRHEPGIT
jgi:hypothetical protein